MRSGIACGHHLSDGERASQTRIAIGHRARGVLHVRAVLHSCVDTPMRMCMRVLTMRPRYCGVHTLRRTMPDERERASSAHTQTSMPRMWCMMRVHARMCAS
jgi:hypothetical protein